VPTVLKSGSLYLLEIPGPVQACNGIALPLSLLFYLVCLATRYGLHDPGIEPQWGEIFRLFRPAIRPTQPLVQLYQVSFPGIKAAGAWFGPTSVEPRLKKEWSYNCTPSLSLHGLLQGEINLFVYCFLFCVNSYA
jgi:hypothetical protein